ncbi:MAG TPA: hydrogenase [Verrucomicrobiota bacterium]|nr:hydrogenase [Verrucomicrobiota bacterium]HOK77341.1 hydrogenase [Verrucomicrobiota bacterium]
MSVELILTVVVLTNLRLLGASRLGACIRTVGLQGLLLGLLPLATGGRLTTLHVVVLAVGSMVLKGFVFPRLLFWALREAHVTREVEPFIGYTGSLLIGGFMLGGAVWLGDRLVIGGTTDLSWVVAVAMFSILTGLFLIVARKRAIHQVLGFLVMENGIYIFGIGAIPGIPLLVELGLLLDIFVAVFVMGIAVYHINREFDHMETDKLDVLRG